MSNADKYEEIIREIEAKAQEYDKAMGDDIRAGYSRAARPTRRMACAMGADVNAEKRDKLLAEAKAHRSYLPFVSRGLMTVAEAVSEVGQGRIATSLESSGLERAAATIAAGKDTRRGLESVAYAIGISGRRR